MPGPRDVRPRNFRLQATLKANRTNTTLEFDHLVLLTLRQDDICFTLPCQSWAEVVAVMSTDTSRKRRQEQSPTRPKNRARTQHPPAGDCYSDDGEISATDFSEEQDEAGSAPGTTPTTPLTAPLQRHPSDANKNHQCPYQDCSKSFNRPAKLAQHVRSHTNERPFVCPHAPCTKNFLRQWHLTHHIKSAHKAERNHVCDRENCAKSFLKATR